MRLRLTEQFSVDAIWTTPESLERCKKEAVCLLKMKGCEAFRHTESYDIERDHKLLRTDGWLTVDDDGSEHNGSALVIGELFYSPIGDAHG